MNAWIVKLKKCSKEYQDEKKKNKTNANRRGGAEPPYKRLPKKLSTPTQGLDKIATFIHDKERKQYVRQNLNMSKKLMNV